MDTAHTLKKIFAGALLAGGIAVSGFGPPPGIGHADPGDSQGPFQWCPGQPLPGHHYQPITIPSRNIAIPAHDTYVVWDNSVCHTYWRTPYGRGNVPMSDGPTSDFWDGPDPPPYFPPVCPPYIPPPPGCRPVNGG